MSRYYNVIDCFASQPIRSGTVRPNNNNSTAMRENITSTINSVYNGLISETDIDRQSRKYTSRVNSARLRN